LRKQTGNAPTQNQQHCGKVASTSKARAGKSTTILSSKTNTASRTTNQQHLYVNQAGKATAKPAAN
jgi:hypothetical protein